MPQSGSYITHDKYFIKAKQSGYKSRAAFKLLELQKKYRLMKSGDCVLDLGAAPGSWTQVALQTVGKSGHVYGADLQKVFLNARPNLTLLKGDLLDDDFRQRFLATIERPIQVVLSDMAPQTSGIKFQDHMNSITLVQMAWMIAQEYLAVGGHFVAKVFPGEELATFKKDLKRCFEKVHEESVTASRKQSKEIFLVALSNKKL